ncbi:hypothetical protein LRS05_12390 [Flavobacterium sp. J372]|uniref:hypothetical protein n=1 Tax=Flavobacterium sp. J372 TaxID=2898436 RepID=UPI0021515B72|nr:hypothetical protein [Flavobacterium sp. J372]MCR5862881.1 hypothetical protein [Flavobacterium sp. J372]
MSNKKLILGIAAGVAALAVVGVVCKRKGYFDGFSGKADEFGTNLKDKFAGIKESAKQKFDEVVQKGGEIADKITHHSDSQTSNTQTAGKSTAGRNTSTGNINPATA